MSLHRLPGLLLRALGALLAHALSPAACAACDAPVPREAVFCATCAATVIRLPPGEDDGTEKPLAFAAFGGAIATALRRLKYEERPDLARPLGHLLRGTAREARLQAEVVVPVPLHPRRLVERGYNQAALLGGAVATELGVPLLPRGLTRLRNTPQQARMGRQERLGNVAQAFQVRDARAVRGRRVLLVDDVATTGATLSACREALLLGGASAVTSLVLARAGDDP